MAVRRSDPASPRGTALLQRLVAATWPGEPGERPRRISERMRTAIVTVVLICAASLAPGQQPADPRADLQRAYEAEDWKTARVTLEAQIEADPDRAALHYNLACVEARAGRADAAIAALRRSAERGFRFLATLTRDGDLDSIRDHAQFADVRGVVARNHAVSLDGFRERAEREATIIVHAPKGRGPHPLIVALHPFGGDAAGFASLHRELADELGAVLVLPQGMTPVGEGWSWGVVEEGEHLIVRAIRRALADHAIDRQRVLLTGFSQGGGMAFTVALRHPELVTGVIPVAGFYDHRVVSVPDSAPAGTLRFYIVNGSLDREADNNRDAARRLRAAGIPVKIEIHEGLGHAYPDDAVGQLRTAFAFVLGEED